VVAQLIQDLVHLESGGQRLDQDGGLDGAPLQADAVLGVAEDVVPQPRLEVGLHLGQVEERRQTRGEQRRPGVEEVHAEVKQRARNRLAVDQQVALGQVPAPRADQQGRRVVFELVVATVRPVVGDAAGDRVVQVDLALDHVAPRRGVGVLEVGHEAVGARVERVDDQLAIRRPGDLHPALTQRFGHGRDPPVAGADLLSLGQEVEHLALGQAGPALHPGAQQLLAPVLEFGMEL
jgi:hypothetical protein